MDNSSTIRRNKIYTYFYGKNTVFQQFLILLGILAFMLCSVAQSASIAGAERREEKSRDKMIEFKAENSDILRGSENDYKYQEVNEEYDKLVNKYNDAQEKLDKLRRNSPSFMVVVLNVLGYGCITVGLAWIVYKKLSFNREGERDYDEELNRCVKEAQKKGMEKLNIIAEQIERVDPVVLHGVAHTEEVAELITGTLSRLFKSILKIVLKFDKLILGTLAAAIINLITSLIASKSTVVFVIMFLLIYGGLGYLGFLVYNKFESESYVSSKTIQNLTRFEPKFMAKLGSDDSIRVSLPAITVYMFGDEQLYVYYQYLDIVTGRIFNEGVSEYFYEDIVGITSAQKTKKIYKRYGFMKLFLKSYDYLRESIAVVSSGCTHTESYIVDVGNSLLDTKFIGMRNLIRQKKMEK